MLQHVIFAEDLKMFSFALTGDNGDPLQKQKNKKKSSNFKELFYFHKCSICTNVENFT